MTEHKSFKRLVRSRMARTGETYSTARRHLLGAAPDTPVRTGGGVEHASALLHNVLRGRIGEAMLAGLAGGIGFMYFVFEYQGTHPTMTIVARHHPEPFIPAALRRAGVEHRIHHTTSARKAEATLRTALDDGPVICTVDRTRLPWHGSSGEWGPEAYPVGVLGIDGTEVVLDDECVHPNRLPLNDFLAAWSADKKVKHELITVGGGYEPDVDGAIATTRAHLTGPVLGNNFDVNFGFSGMRKLAEQLRGDGRQSWIRRWADPAGLFFALRRLHDCLEVEFTGPSASRPLYAEFLREVGRPEAAGLFDASGRVWTDIADRAVALTPALLDYDEIVTERLRLQLTEGAAASSAIRSLNSRIVDLQNKMASDPPAEDQVREALGGLAALADRARELEESALTAL
ncbi:BtrH N-terminal domain-containing protein [Actinosynnema sp. CS-041913]|uniref:BtrH N-terminal domain-containing protein n=1 Tax=Actinosynnema sp. CS-041913 TaxID=3239917 RepID=UPI003D90D902